MMVKFTFLAFYLGVIPLVAANHTFIFRNFCSHKISPKVTNVNCGYSPRCSQPGSGGVANPAISYNGPQPNPINFGQSSRIIINRQWNGRVFQQEGNCGRAGEGCTMGEFNLDTGNKWTAHAFDISNIQGFSQSMKIEVAGGDSVVCTSANCGCHNAYPTGDMTGCVNDLPVRAASAGDKTFTITFCP